MPLYHTPTLKNTILFLRIYPLSVNDQTIACDFCCSVSRRRSAPSLWVSGSSSVSLQHVRRGMNVGWR